MLLLPYLNELELIILHTKKQLLLQSKTSHKCLLLIICFLINTEYHNP